MNGKKIDLVEIIINNMPDNLLLPIEKARYIYIELGKILEFNVTYNNTDEFRRFIIKNKHYNIRNLSDNQIVCHNWADIYVELLELVGIEARKVSQHHAWVEFKADNLLIYADATIDSYNDLSRIKHNDKTIGFYPISDEKTVGLPFKLHVDGFSELIDDIDKKIGYKKNQHAYLQELKKKISSFSTLKEKVDYLLHDIDVIVSGYYEQTAYINYVFSLCLDYDERKNISVSELKKTKGDNTVDVIKCIALANSDSYTYYVFENNVGISELSKQELLSYADSDYGIYDKNDYRAFRGYPLRFEVPKSSISIILNNIFSFQKNLLRNKTKQKGEL